MTIGQQITDSRRPGDSGRAGGGRAWQAAAVVSAVLMGMAGAALAQTADRVLSTCTLDGATGALETRLQAAGIDIPEVAFVVVYSISNENNGQALSRGFTGPVICRNSTLVSIADTQTTTSFGTVDVLDAASAFLLRYQDGAFQTRLCHTVDSNTDCFRITRSGSGG